MAAIDSVLAQSWTDWRLTLIDDGSTDGTADILAEAARRDARIGLKRNRCNVGAVGAFQRGLWHGDADYVMLKSADDLIAPEFIERLMGILRAHPECAVAHAGGLSFSGGGHVDFVYPESHRLHAVGPDPLRRAAHVMRHYTSSPSFWGIYRRGAVDRLAPIACRPGWDHVVLAELSLYGEIRHDPGVMYWRRGTGRPVRTLARAATAAAARGLDPEQDFLDAIWRAPCVGTAYAHIENFLVARLPEAQRLTLVTTAQACFEERWGALMRREAVALRDHFRHVAGRASCLAGPVRALAGLRLAELLAALSLLLPDEDFDAERRALSDLTNARSIRCPA